MTDSIDPLTPPPQVITVDMLTEWLLSVQELGYGELPVEISYEAQRGQRAHESPSSIYLDDNQSRPVERTKFSRLVISGPIRG